MQLDSANKHETVQPGLGIRIQAHTSVVFIKSKSDPIKHKQYEAVTREEPVETGHEVLSIAQIKRHQPSNNIVPAE